MKIYTLKAFVENNTKYFANFKAMADYVIKNIQPFENKIEDKANKEIIALNAENLKNLYDNTTKQCGDNFGASFWVKTEFLIGFIEREYIIGAIDVAE